MTDVFIKYNPYRVETTIEIDGEPVQRSSALYVEDRRLQEWVDDLPQNLMDECNTNKFHVTFHGTTLDFEDLQSVLQDANKRGFEFQVSDHIPAKEVADKEKAIDEIFHEIQNGPFAELREPDLLKAFRNAQSSDFPVNVIATMSAGKSTLINALLRKKLMPAKQEACTATITEIKDADGEDFHAIAYDAAGDAIKSVSELSLREMEELNSNPSVSVIKAEGDIPFVNSDDISLVLVDTPGPNNSRDESHKRATQKALSESSKTLVLYILNATQLAVNDDNTLLDEVSESMKVGGKQSRDRFIFVVNKLDDFKPGEDSVAAAIAKVRKYLEDKGIVNANIYPASALTALEVRTILKDMRVVGYSEAEHDEMDPEIGRIINNVKKINRSEEHHLEQYAPLPPSVRENIEELIQEATKKTKSSDNTEKSEGLKELALIHSGVVPVERAIRTYVLKYAKTAKIKNIVDTFAKKLESAGSFERTKQEIASNQNKKDAIVREINAIQEKLNSGLEAKKFKDEIDRISYDAEIKKISEDAIKKAQTKIREQIAGRNGQQWKRYEAENNIRSFERFASELQAQVQVRLEELVSQHVEKNARALLDQYKRKLADLASELSGVDIEIRPFDMVNGDLPSVNVESLLNATTAVERIKIGEHKEKNDERKGFLGFFKVWKPWSVTVSDYENREYIDGGQLAERFFAPFEEQLYSNQRSAVEYAQEQARTIKSVFKKKFEELDRLLDVKLKALQACAEDQKSAEKILKKTQENLAWLESIQNRIQDILDI